jgi:hypothetical protein
MSNRNGFEEKRHLYFVPYPTLAFEGFLSSRDVRFENGEGGGSGGEGAGVGGGEGPGGGEPGQGSGEGSPGEVGMGAGIGSIGADANGDLGFGLVSAEAPVTPETIEIAPTPFAYPNPNAEPDLVDITMTIPEYEQIVEGQKSGWTFIGKDTAKAIGGVIDIGIASLVSALTHGIAALGIGSGLAAARAAGISPGQLAMSLLSKDQYGNLVISSSVPSSPSASTPSGTPSGEYGGNPNAEQPLTNIFGAGYGYSPELLSKQISQALQPSIIPSAPATVKPLPYSMDLSDIMNRALFNVSAEEQQAQTQQEAQKAGFEGILFILLAIGLFFGITRGRATA